MQEVNLFSRLSHGTDSPLSGSLEALDFPVPVLRGYSRETVVAEKLEALTTLGLLNSRLKDYYDVALLARTYPFNGQRLVEAITATFRQRQTQIDPEPVGLAEGFAHNPAREAQWRAFLRRSRLSAQSSSLPALVAEVQRFAVTPLSAAAREQAFEAAWLPGGPWK